MANNERYSLTHLSLLQHEIRQVAAENLSAAPADPVVGQFYFNTEDDAFCVWTGEEWVCFSDGCCGEVVLSDDALVGAAPDGAKIGFDRATESLYYVNADGNWQAQTQSVYGSEFYLLEHQPVFATGSTAWTDVINGNIGPVEGGTYQITVSYNWTHEAMDTDFLSQFLFDGANPFLRDAMHRQEPSDADGTWAGIANGQAFGFTRVVYVTTGAGVKNIRLRIRSEQAGNRSAMWMASVAVVRAA